MLVGYVLSVNQENLPRIMGVSSNNTIRKLESFQLMNTIHNIDYRVSVPCMKSNLGTIAISQLTPVQHFSNEINSYFGQKFLVAEYIIT